MKIKSIISAVFIANSLIASSWASNITLSDFSGSGATFGQNVINSSGGQLLSGTPLVRIGYFSNFSAADNAAGSAFRTALNGDRTAIGTLLTSRFVPLGEGLDADLGPVPASTARPRVATRTGTINGVAGLPGRLQGGVANVVPTGAPANSFDAGNITGVPGGTRLFVLVYDGADFAGSSELAVFSADGAATWLMPTANASSTTLNTTLIDTELEIFRGSQGSIRLAPIIPEPSSSLLGLIGLGLIARRRR